MVTPRKRHKSVMHTRGGSTSDSLRQKLTEAQEGRCAYCGQDGAYTVDHVIPFSMGGPNSACNKVLACSLCNSTKSKTLEVEWLTRGIRELIRRGEDVSWIDDFRFPWQESADRELERESEGRLTPEQVAKIRDLNQARLGFGSIAKRLGLTREQVRRAVFTKSPES